MKIEIPEAISNAPERHLLTIEIHPQHFSFSIYNPLEDGSFYYTSINQGKGISAFAQFQQFFFEHKFLSLPYRKVIVINHTHLFTFVPTLIFRDQDKEHYFKFNFSEYSGKILLQQLHYPALTLLHVLPQAEYDFFQRSFIKVEYLHHLSSQIAYCSAKSKMINANKLYINIKKDNVDVLVFSHNQFLMGNSFETKNQENCLYYILFVWKQFEFDQTRDFVYVTGLPDLKSTMIQSLRAFVHNVVPLNIVPERHLQNVDITSVPFEMISLTLCEL